MWFYKICNCVLHSPERRRSSSASLLSKEEKPKKEKKEKAKPEAVAPVPSSDAQRKILRGGIFCAWRA